MLALTVFSTRSKVHDSLFLGSHEGVVSSLILLRSIGDELDVSFLSASNMGDCKLSQFDSSFTVLLDDIAANVGVTLASLNDDAIMTARRDRILPDLRSTQLRPVGTSNLDSILVASFDRILNQMGLVVIDLDSHLVQVE